MNFFTIPSRSWVVICYISLPYANSCAIYHTKHIQFYEIQTQHPYFQGLMMSIKKKGSVPLP